MMRSRTVLLRPLAVGSIVLISACSGGGSAPSAISPVASSAPAAPVAAKKYAVTVTLANVAPATSTSTSARALKSREYISPATGGVVVTATSTTAANQAANDGTFGFDLNAGNPNCVSNATTGSLDCSIAFALAADTYTISVTAYDQTEATLPASPGTPLSNDTETITVSPNSAADVFSFTPKPYVAGFSLGSSGKRGTSDRGNARASVQRDALAPTAAGLRIGAAGGTASSISETLHALDRDGYLIDQYPGQAPFENGIFLPSVSEFGDLTGCTSAAPCSHVANSAGTTYPAYASTSTPAQIAQATTTLEALTFAYSGGGDIGAGIEAWKTGSAPTGQAPYYADFSIPDPSGGTVAPYVVPHLYIVPLYAYATDGAGHEISSTADTNSTAYVWAAQALTPGGTDPSGGNYFAYFDASGTSTCADSSGATVLTLGTPTFYAGYGTVFPISVTPDLSATCTLDTFDGDGDTAKVVLSVPEAQIVVR